MPTTPTTPPRTWQREELMHLLSLSATLAGLCITGVTLVHTLGRSTFSSSIADDMLALSALSFLVCAYLLFFALRLRRPTLNALLARVADVMFLLALTGMVMAGFIMLYTVW